MSRTNRGIVFLCLFGAIISLSVQGFAQQAGSIRGTVYDKDYDIPLAGAQVLIAENGLKTAADDSGGFVFSKVAPGKYTLVFSKDGYARQVSSDVVVPEGQMTEVSSSLAGEYTEMDELVVQDLQLGGGMESGLLNLRMESPALMDSISAELMSRAGASDAAGALRMVPGATVQDGKYAVVRGLPDRYVNSQMNGVRLPSADPDKRAVQLDQFPSVLIESIQISKTFIPDQQGDASGGAVNVVLKGIPDQSVLKFKVGTKYKTNVNGKDFLTYTDGGVNFWGIDNGKRKPQTPGTSWSGAVGAGRGEAPPMYDWEVTSGGKHEFDNGIKIGGLANFFYKQDAKAYADGINDKYWVDNFGDPMTPQKGGSSLFDVRQSTDEVQWGTLDVLGVETERNKFKLLYMRTHAAQDKATIAENTRGKAYAFPGYNPYDLNDPGNAQDTRDVVPYLRNQTLEYTERNTDTIQLSGDHTLPFPEIGIPKVITFLEPEIDWTLSKNSSGLNSPDKRMFGEMWLPPLYDPGFPSWGIPPSTNASVYLPNKPESNFTMGNAQRIWKKVSESSDQVSLSGKLPFEQWSNEKGFLKAGFFNDKVTREYRQDSYSNLGDNSARTGDWTDSWGLHFPSETHNMYAADIDVNYDGEQEINAWYYMGDLPLTSFFKVTGGARYESTALDINLNPDPGVLWIPPGTSVSSYLSPGVGDVKFQQDDILPSVGFELTPAKSFTVKANYSETVARQTFKELTPIQQMEYLGGDVFIGNPGLTMSALKNYDLRADYTPFEGSLVSASWFRKDVVDPIEYVQDYAVNIGLYTRPVNYPEGTLNGYEFEVRQQLGRLWNPLEGLAVGANATVIQSEVTLPANEAAALESLGFSEPTRVMLNAPVYLYNLNLTHDIKRTGTQLGLFYTVQGDTLVAGAGQSGGNYVPDVYAKEYGTLNFSVSQKIGKYLKLTFQAKNLMDPEIQEVYRSEYISGGDTVKTSYKRGIDYSLSLGGEF